MLVHFFPRPFIPINNNRLEELCSSEKQKFVTVSQRDCKEILEKGGGFAYFRIVKVMVFNLMNTF